MIEMFVLMGVIFGFLAGLMAFLITWKEWERHRFKGKKILKESLSVGVFTFLFFLILSSVLGIVFSHLNL